MDLTLRTIPLLHESDPILKKEPVYWDFDAIQTLKEWDLVV